MSGITKLVSDMQIPDFVRVKQYFPHNELTQDQIREIIAKGFLRPEMQNSIKPGMKICITAGSRGLSNMLLIDREIVSHVRELGAEPFLIPAMGSHGGATDEGQKKMLEGLGISEESVGCPIRSSMQTDVIDHIEGIGDVNIDHYAAQADGIIVVNRVKAHTGFKGKYESGLMKMMTIGLGKQKGAYVAHSGGDDAMPERIFAIGSSILHHAKIIMGIALIENAYDKTCRIECLTPDEIPVKEPGLLEYAKKEMGHIFLDSCDVLILREIGKNYSGGGMDPNVVGRSRLPIGIKSERMGIFGLSEASHGNATGMGRADVATQKFFHQISFDDTYPNAITDHDSSVYKIPIITDNEEECMKTAMAICLHMNREAPRIIILDNSLNIEEILISEAMIPEAEEQERLTIETKPFPLEFDAAGDLLTQVSGKKR